MQTPDEVQPIYIDTNQALAERCQQWASCAVLALDTEFIRTDTFYPIGALVQVSDGQDCFLIDPLAIDDRACFADLLTDQSIVKVLHSCSEDLEVFVGLFGVLPSPLIDTQIAAALDGHGFSLGYQAMTELLLGIHVPKGETRSNWLQRPLTESQIHYAALDVAYLPQMYQMLLASLEEKGRSLWLQQECDLLHSNYLALADIDNYYKKVASAWRLSSRDLTLLQRLTQWREKEARARDIPRGRVVKDRSLFSIAKLKPHSTKELATIDELTSKMVRCEGEQLLAIINSADAFEQSELLEQLPKPLPPAVKTLMKKLKAYVSRRAEELNLAAEVLIRKKDYEALIRSGIDGESYSLPESLSGWKKAIIGDDLLAVIASDQSSSIGIN
jgi:ribonuclease D